MERLWIRLAVALFAFLWVTVAISQTHVRGYYRKNGTYVAPHYRSSPNSSRLDNWSTKGNVNPYTGQPGTRNPYPQPRTYTSPTYYYPRTYSVPAYRPPAPSHQSYSYPSTAYRSYSAPSSLAPRVSQPYLVDPEVLRWYRCDDGNGEYHYSHNPGPTCVFSGTSRRGS